MTRHLSPVPDAVLRDGRYVRVSAVMGRTDERFLSPEIQCESIDRARLRGPASRIVDTWRDIDVSTARVKIADRPGLQAALTAARDGRIDRLWVLTLDRFDRDTGALKVFDEIAALGVELWTEAGRLDMDTAEGYLSTTMQLAIARYQRDRIGKAWRQTHQHRLERGLPHSGKARAGYVYDLEQRLHVPDPVSGPALAEVYRRYVSGESIYSLVRWLNDIGVTTTEGNPWRDRVLRRNLDSGFAAGVLTYAGVTYDGVHEPLISRDLWAQYQACRVARRVHVNTERSQYVLSGLVRCGQCGGAMVAGQYGANHQPKYRCSTAKESGNHAGGYVMASFVEGLVLDWLRGVAVDVDTSVDLGKVLQSQRARRAVDVTVARREVDELEGQVQQLVRHLVSGRLTEAEFDRAATENRAAQDELRARIAAAELELALPAVTAPTVLAADLLADWDVLPIAMRRELLRRLIARVEVTTGRPRASVVVVPRWA